MDGAVLDGVVLDRVVFDGVGCVLMELCLMEL